MSVEIINTTTQKQNGVAVKKNGQVYSRTGEKVEDERLLQAYSYIMQVPGKNIRAKMQAAFNFWLNVPDEKMDVVEDIIRIVHNASLLLDDIEDNSVLRRGIPVAHSVFGTSSTISSANYITSIALEKVLQLGRSDATMAFIEQVLELQRGQGMDIYWRDHFICPTEEEYSLMVMRKTGGLFMMAIRFMQLYSSNTEDFSKLVNTLGLSFQIIDDYKNIISKDYFKSKTYCEDITEGKFSFPVIHAVHAHPENSEILDILRLRTSDNKIKRRCVDLLKKYGSIEYTRRKIAALWDQALEENDRLGANPYMEVVISSIFKDTV